MSTKHIITIALILVSISAQAQLRYGFKTGLNFAKMNGTSELSDAGLALEKWTNTTGFHIGMSLAYPITDNFSLRGEFLYSKRGAKYYYEGKAFRIFRYDGGTTKAFGDTKHLVNINNSYLDFPIMAVGRFGDFEFSAGGYFGFNIQSIGDGALSFTNGKVDDSVGTPIENLEFNLNYNYRRDEAGEIVEGESLNPNIKGKIITVPKTHGAYFDYTEDKGNLFKTLDYGLVGGVSYFFSRSLYIGGRLQYGLADITNNKADQAKTRTGANNELLFRDDKDRNFVIQASVGFSF